MIKILDKIKSYASLVTSVGVIAGVLFGAYRFADKVTDQAEILIEIQEHQKEIQVRQAVVIDSIASLARQVNDLALTIEGVSENTIMIGNYVEGVNKALIYHVQRSSNVSKEDYAAMMEIISELKKKERPIASSGIGSTELLSKGLSHE